MPEPDRKCDIESFYKLLNELEERVGGKRTLDEFGTGIGRPVKGVYFLFEPGEHLDGDPKKQRVVRVGSHGRRANSRSTIWTRLFEHKLDGGRSIFRNHVNAALRKKAQKEERWLENHRHGACISKYIGRMPFIWVKVDGEEGHKKRGYIERNAIKLLSTFDRVGDTVSPSDDWLGKWSPKSEIRKSGLWNVQHTKKADYCPSFLSDLRVYIENTEDITEHDADWNRSVCLDSCFSEKPAP